MGKIFSKSDDDDDEEELWPYIWAIREPECLDWKNNLDDEEINMHAQKQMELPVPITDWLYLSNHRSACDIAKLKALGITHVLNVAGPEARGPVESYQVEGITYKEVDAEDEEGYDMLGKHLDECQSFVAAAVGKSGKALVHCVAGINRSGVIVASIHLLGQAREDSNSEDVNVLKTVAHCRLQRGNIFLCNETFQRQLVTLAKRNSLLGPPPGHQDCIVAQNAPRHMISQERPKKNIKILF